MAKTFSLGLVINAVGFSSAAHAIGSVEKRIDAIGSTIDRMKTRQRDAMQSFDRELVWGGKSVRKYAEEVDWLGKRIDALNARKMRLNEIGVAHTTARADMNSRAGDVVMAAGIGATMVAPGIEAARFQDRVKQISITGEMYKQIGAEDALAGDIRRAAVQYGVNQNMVAEGVEKLVAQGMDAGTAKKYGGLMARVHVATRAEMGDLAELVYTLQTKFKLTTEGEIMQAINALTKAGKLGQYELKQMARSFPELGGAAASFGSTGLEGVREMGAMMQVMRKGAGSTGEADTYMRNWFSHLSARATQENFQKVGINFERAKLKLMIDKRVSAVEAGFMVFDEYLNRVTKQGFVEIRDKKGRVVERVDARKELARAVEIAKKEGLQGEALQERVKAAVERLGLSAVLQDTQATQAYLAWRTGKEEYTKARKELARSETDQTVDNDYAEQMKLATVQTEYMKVAVTDLMIEIGNRLTPVFGKVAQGIGWFSEKVTSLMQQFPQTATTIVGVAGALALGVGGFFAIGTAMAALRFAWTGAQLLPGMMSIGRAASWLGGILKGGLLSGLYKAGQALIWFGRAALMTPVGLAITGAILLIAGVAYLIYRNWDRLKPWFQGLWRGVVSIFNGTMAWFKGLPARFGEIGRNLIDGLIGGVTSRINAAREAIVGLGSKIKGWFSETLGIRSPSRVFTAFGGNIGEGAAIGITSSVSRVKGAVSKLSGAALSGVSAASQTLNAMMSGGGGSAGGPAKVEVTYSPTITVQGGGDVAGQVKKGLDLSLHELEKMIQRVMAEQGRRAYG